MNEYDYILNRREMSCNNCAHSETFIGSPDETRDEADADGWRIFHTENEEQTRVYVYCPECQ